MISLDQLDLDSPIASPSILTITPPDTDRLPNDVPLILHAFAEVHAARTGPRSPSPKASPRADSSNAGPSGSTSGSASVSASAPPTPSGKVHTLTPEVAASLRGAPQIKEEEGRWFLPRPSRPASSSTLAPAAHTLPTFESSYVPFLAPTSTPSAGASSSTGQTSRAAGPSMPSTSSGGGGRMTFGGFGSKPREEVASAADDDDEDEDMDSERESGPSGRAVGVRRDKGKSRADATAPTRDDVKPRTFLRPAVSPPPTTSNTSPTARPIPSASVGSPAPRQHKPSQDSKSEPSPRPMSVSDKMRASIASRSNPANSPLSKSTTSKSEQAKPTKSGSTPSQAGSDATASSKKKKGEKRSAPSDHGSPLINKKVKVETGAGAGTSALSLDEREKAIKAEKKKAKKKAKEAGKA